MLELISFYIDFKKLITQLFIFDDINLRISSCHNSNILQVIYEISKASHLNYLLMGFGKLIHHHFTSLC